MARIFYSMAGEGRGHATRVRAIVEQLGDEHEFTLFAPAAAYDLLATAYAESSVRVIQIPGLMFHYTHQRMNYLRTFTDAARYLWQMNPLIGKLEGMIRDEHPDLVITDFEPALPRAAERCGVPYMSIDHQHFLLEYDLSSLPWSLRATTNMMAPMVGAYYGRQVETVISSFYFPPLLRSRRKITQTGVLLRPDVVSAIPERAGHLLVYLRRFASASMLDALKNCGRDVRIYGLGNRPSDGRLSFCPIDEMTFVEDLAACDALISNAGNQLVGEALHLGKPVLAIPEAKNFEQYVNAHFLRAEGGGDWVRFDQFNSQTLKNFLTRIEAPWQAIHRDRMNGMPAVLEAIDRNLSTSRVPAFAGAQMEKVA